MRQEQESAARASDIVEEVRELCLLLTADFYDLSRAQVADERAAFTGVLHEARQSRAECEIMVDGMHTESAQPNGVPPLFCSFFVSS